MEAGKKSRFSSTRLSSGMPSDESRSLHLSLVSQLGLARPQAGPEGREHDGWV